MSTPAAFFDMDRTLIRVNTGTEWVKWMRKRGEMTRLKMLQALGWLAQYKLSILDMEAVFEKGIAEMAGELEQPMIDKAMEFNKLCVFPQVAPKGLQALEYHRKQGHVVAILSSSTPYVTEPLARHLGIEHVLCTRLPVRDGKFVGIHTRPACYGLGKVHWAEAFAREQEIDLTRSFFYTDSYSDLPMLERVGIKRVINPDTRLARHARRAGWEVDQW
jgi:HAD superfamily hydrolase (TIGR01490 family)